MTWGIPVRTAGRAGFSARRGNEGEAIKAQKNYAAQECDARPNGWPGGQRWWVINPLPASKKVNCG